MHDTDDFQAVDVKRTTSGSSFNVTYKGKDLGNFFVPLFGEHNIFNSLAVVAVAYFEDVNLDEIRKELKHSKVLSADLLNARLPA